MPLFSAKMRDIDPRRWVIGMDFEYLSDLKGLEPFPGFENRQRTEEPSCIQDRIRRRHGPRYRLGHATSRGCLRRC